jgi:hypothetical protein
MEDVLLLGMWCQRFNKWWELDRRMEVVRFYVQIDYAKLFDLLSGDLLQLWILWLAALPEGKRL